MSAPKQFSAALTPALDGVVKPLRCRKVIRAPKHRRMFSLRQTWPIATICEKLFMQWTEGGPDYDPGVVYDVVPDGFSIDTVGNDYNGHVGHAMTGLAKD